MMMNNISTHIIELISSYTANEISESDFNVLKNWIDQSPENKTLFSEYLLVYKRSRQISFAEYIDNEKAWNIVSAQLKGSLRPSPHSNNTKTFRLPTSFLKYAAAAVFIGFFVTIYFLNENRMFQSSEPLEEIVTINNIKPGTHKAKLTLEDGSEILLEKNSKYSHKNISSDGKGIVYNVEKNVSEKVIYNYLSIPRGGEFHIKLSDGTEVWLNSETQLKYPTCFIEGEARQVELVYGEAYFDVSPSTKHKGASFTVVHKNQNINVLGTEFNVKAYQDEAIIYTTLVEGKVLVSHSKNKQILQPDQQYAYHLLEKTSTVSDVNVYNEVSWRNGVFSFENKSLKEIMTVLSRWYDMTVEFENANIEDEEFIGILYKDRSIERILKNIKSVGAIKNYEIRDKNVILK